MRFAKILSVATLPMFLFACSDDAASVRPSSHSETPQDTSKTEPPPNILDDDLKPIERDYSLIWPQGDGSAENPYQISNEQELKALAFYVNDSSMTFKDKYFKQTADIALTEAWEPIGLFGKNAYGLGNRPFSGTFDGDSKTISGMTINDTASYKGLFGLARGAVVKNVVLKSAKMVVGTYAGALAGKMDSSVVDNCVLEDIDVSGMDRVGGLIGEASHVSVANVVVSGVVKGENSVGGVVGRLQDGAFDHLTNKAEVSGKSTVGGVAGAFATTVNSDGSVTEGEGFVRDLLNYGKVSGTKDVGGVMATLSATKLDHAGNYGSVNADESAMSNVGGVIAVASSKSVLNEVFNAGAVTVKKVLSAGGVFGSVKGATVTNVFNIAEVSGTATNMGGIMGIVDGESNVDIGYNAGKVPDNNVSGTVAGKVSSTVTVSNVYYDKTVGGTCLVVANQMNMELPTGLSTEEVKAASFIATLNGTGSVWKAGSATFGGYPAFSWVE
jgi:hypothetical protein